MFDWLGILQGILPILCPLLILVWVVLVVSSDREPAQGYDRWMDEKIREWVFSSEPVVKIPLGERNYENYYRYPKGSWIEKILLGTELPAYRGEEIADKIWDYNVTGEKLARYIENAFRQAALITNDSHL